MNYRRLVYSLAPQDSAKYQVPLPYQIAPYLTPNPSLAWDRVRELWVSKISRARVPREEGLKKKKEGEKERKKERESLLRFAPESFATWIAHFKSQRSRLPVKTHRHLVIPARRSWCWQRPLFFLLASWCRHHQLVIRTKQLSNKFCPRRQHCRPRVSQCCLPCISLCALSVTEIATSPLEQPLPHTSVSYKLTCTAVASRCSSQMPEKSSVIDVVLYKYLFFSPIISYAHCLPLSASDLAPCSLKSF